MTCAACSGAIERHFKSMQKDGVVSVAVSLLTNTALIEYHPSQLGPRHLIEEIEDLGFEAELQTGDQQHDIREIAAEEV